MCWRDRDRQNYGLTCQFTFHMYWFLSQWDTQKKKKMQKVKKKKRKKIEGIQNMATLSFSLLHIYTCKNNCNTHVSANTWTRLFMFTDPQDCSSKLKQGCVLWPSGKCFLTEWTNINFLRLYEHFLEPLLWSHPKKLWKIETTGEKVSTVARSVPNSLLWLLPISLLHVALGWKRTFFPRKGIWVHTLQWQGRTCDLTDGQNHLHIYRRW